VPKTANIDPETHQVLISLNSRNGLRLYFLFFEMVLIAMDADCTVKANRYFYQQRLQAF